MKHFLRGVTVLLGLLGILSPAAGQDPCAAIVRINSHGCSATVIETKEGHSWLLSCAHAFQGADRQKPLMIDCPWPTSGRTEKGRGARRVVRVGNMESDDLALIELDDGPLPFVCPVASGEPKPRECLSVGYSDMQWPAEKIPVTVRWHQDTMYLTQGYPKHGQSGGALIDRHSGQLVGVVSGYEWDGANGPYRGRFVDLETIRAFLAGQPARAAGGNPPLARGPRQAPGHPPLSFPRFGQPALRDCPPGLG